MVQKTPHAQISSFQWLLTPLFGLRGGQEGYGMKMDDFQLVVHLLPCSLMNNSNVAFAFFALALKLKVSPCQSRPRIKQKIKLSRINTNASKRDVQRTDQREKGHGYILNFLILRKKLKKKWSKTLQTLKSLLSSGF